MDKTIYVEKGYGEYGIDTEASPGNGKYYVRMYDGSFWTVGYTSKKEAKEELGICVRIAKRRELGLKLWEPFPE